MSVVRLLCVVIALGLTLPLPSVAEEAQFEPLDVFELEWAADPQISPDGTQIAYVRYFMDVMADRRRSNIWLVDFDGSSHRPLTSGNHSNTSPRWSPSGDRLLYVSSEDGSAQLHMRWMDTGQSAKITRLTHPRGSISWSPDGQWLAFPMRIPAKQKPLASAPPRPDGAKWADPPKVIESLVYRSDGGGFIDPGYWHLFVVPAEGGSPRQLTTGDFNHQGTPAWSVDGESILITGDRREGWEYDPVDGEIYEVSLADGAIRALTDRDGPDGGPVLSPDGTKIAYTGFDDQLHGYNVSRLYVMNRDGSESRLITGDFDRSVQGPTWAGDGRGLFFQYNTEGNGKVGYVSLSGKVETLADDLGNSIGRPYSGGSFSVAANGNFAFTTSPPDRPADVAVGSRGQSGSTRVTNLNADLLDHKELAEVEEIWWESSFDGRQVQGWIATPPGFDPEKKYPLIMEIHGGPFANYGDRFSSEVQMFAAAGYVVFYSNPRGSSSYGKEFGNLIHHNYPGQDYDDLMSGVDAVLAKGYVDEEQLFVTGGSGGGVLTAWIVGHTDRFAAAVSAKPVINWYSFVLTADFYPFFYKYWFPGFPWDHPEQYLERSPLHHVGKVSTPTMLLTGEVDYRTPMSESEQYYQALKLRKIDTALVRIPGASHGIAQRPSQLIAKISHILAWFERYRSDDEADADSDDETP